MEIQHGMDVEEMRIESFPYRGKPYEVKGIGVRWLSRCGDDGHGYPEYGLRLFTAEGGGEIPIHNHFYHQTMYILTGRFVCYAYDPKTDEVIEEVEVGPGDSIYIPSLEPHGMKNLSDTDQASFLCCIANVYDEDQ